MIDKILQEFDELIIEAQKRAEEIKNNLKDKSVIVSCPIDYKQFITKAIEQAVAEERKRILDALPICDEHYHEKDCCVFCKKLKEIKSIIKY